MGAVGEGLLVDLVFGNELKRCCGKVGFAKGRTILFVEDTLRLGECRLVETLIVEGSA